MTQQVYHRVLTLAFAINMLAGAVHGRGVTGDVISAELRVQKIHNGSPAEPGSHPYIALIVMDNHLDFSICGGTLISSQWVLTAAHCVDEFKTKEQMKKIKVKLGALKFDDPKIKPLDVEDVIIHYNYGKSVTGEEISVNDIALVKLKEPASIKTNVVEVAKLDDGKTSDERTQCVISGWGDTKANQIRHTNDLMEATTYTMTNKACLDLIHKLTDHEFDSDDDADVDDFIPEKLICAYNADKAMVQGDSGGPLVCGSPKVLVGVFAEFFWNAEGPQIFTRVWQYRGWIRRYTGL